MHRFVLFTIKSTVLLLLSTTVLAHHDEISRIPQYENNTLHVPLVDSDTQPALFQDGLFKFDAAIDAWRLISFRQTPVIPGLIADVELIKTDTHPVQVFLKISSPDIFCYSPGKIGLRKTETHFELSAGFTAPPPDTGCVAALQPFERTVQLPVFDLPAGIYQYTVNNEFEGVFELTEENTLPE